MSTTEISIKHNNHRVHPCPSEKKLELLNLLIKKNSKMKITIVTANNLELLKKTINEGNITVVDDNELIKSNDLISELLISYDLPDRAIIYMARLAKATGAALILLDSSEQKELYPIETLLGRAIKQEVVAGFEYQNVEKFKVAQESKKPKKEYAFNASSGEKPKYDKPKRDGFKSEKKPYDRAKGDVSTSEKKPYDKAKKADFNSEKKPYDKTKKDDFKSDKKPYDKAKQGTSSDNKPKKWDNKNKSQNKFLGKDENGKAIFSGKSKDRNHRYDGSAKETPETVQKVGRKINIKALKPKEDAKPSS